MDLTLAFNDPKSSIASGAKTISKRRSCAVTKVAVLERDQVNRSAATTACQKEVPYWRVRLKAWLGAFLESRVHKHGDAPTAIADLSYTNLCSIWIHPSSLAALPFAQLPASAHLRGQGGLSRTAAVARTP